MLSALYIFIAYLLIILYLIISAEILNKIDGGKGKDKPYLYL